jgi:hypothetical protein
MALRLTLRVTLEAGVGASGGENCHESRRRWCLFLFGRRSAVVVADLLAATDPLFCFI